MVFKKFQVKTLLLADGGYQKLCSFNNKAAKREPFIPNLEAFLARLLGGFQLWVWVLEGRFRPSREGLRYYRPRRKTWRLGGLVHEVKNPSSTGALTRGLGIWRTGWPLECSFTAQRPQNLGKVPSKKKAYPRVQGPPTHTKPAFRSLTPTIDALKTEKSSLRFKK